MRVLDVEPYLGADVLPLCGLRSYRAVCRDDGGGYIVLFSLAQPPSAGYLMVVGGCGECGVEVELD